MNIKMIFSRTLITLVLLSFAVSCGDKEQTAAEKTEAAKDQSSIKNSTLEELSASVILAIKENHPDLLADVIATRTDIENILSIYQGTEEEKKEILAGSEENAKNILANTQQALPEIRAKAEKAGVMWEEAKFSNAEYKTKKENNIETADLLITFSFKDLNYKIQIAECIKTKRGWLIFDKPKWKG